MLIDPELKERNPAAFRRSVGYLPQYQVSCAKWFNYILETILLNGHRECNAKLHPVQNAIHGFGNAVARVSVFMSTSLMVLQVTPNWHTYLPFQVVPLLSHPNDHIVCEVLAFLKVIFYSGNRTVQEGMKHLLSTREERLFTTMKAMLQNTAIIYKERSAICTNNCSASNF